MSHLSVVHVADLGLHVLDSFLQVEQFFSEDVLIITEIIAIFLYTIEEGFIVGDRFVNGLFVFVQIFFIDLFQVVKISIDTFIGLRIFKFDIVEKFHIGGYFFIDWLEKALNLVNFASDGLSLCLFHNIYKIKMGT